MRPVRIGDGVFWAGAPHWERRIFDSLVPLPDGTSYNAYLIRGSKGTALIDTVDPSQTRVLLSHLDGIERLDFIVSNHAEQDHSGSIPAVLERYREARVVASPKGKSLLMDHLHIPGERIVTVKDNERLSLGDKTIEFLFTPWVHWPETISTYLREERILFSCDLFGSHLATSGPYCDDEWKVCEAAKRYYAEVMMPFRSVIGRHIDRFEALDIDTIAPSHGPIYDDPGKIMGLHRQWISDEAGNTVVVPFATMHGSTALMVERLTEGLGSRGINVEVFDLSVTDIGMFIMSLVDAATIVFGSSTVLSGAHPFVIQAAFLANSLRPKLRYASIIGSYGWTGRTVEQISQTISGLKLELLDPVMVKGRPGPEGLRAVERLAGDIAERHAADEKVRKGLHEKV